MPRSGSWFRRTPSPSLILGYAAFEGAFLGFLSGVVSTYVAPGLVAQAVPACSPSSRGC
ncbi:Bax inhibitor-1/YccA family protein [Streptomyces sp. NPDC006527]|uniref:Bax inhibitor-1/YccA family membrane protein n=1 Tax=Streptomyces sp. NPDC006527 TaxID=3364749 RepID=UPI00367AADA4